MKYLEAFARSFSSRFCREKNGTRSSFGLFLITIKDKRRCHPEAGCCTAGSSDHVAAAVPFDCLAINNVKASLLTQTVLACVVSVNEDVVRVSS